MFYFTYGLNMDRDDLAKACVKKGIPTPYLTHEKQARLPGWTLRFNFFSATRMSGTANIVFTGQSGDCVHGAVYEVDEVGLKIIDWHEGVPRAYARQIVDVVLADGNRLPGVVTHVVLKGREMDQHVPPAKDYLAHIVNNARRLGFPVEYVKQLEAIKTTER
jgi:gamma-glutamylcyclotransferase (GGCT)/AIG2-like uncharacterized protein YtfP